jgi:phosphosulfolactate phosphohydrolase-like enzyme
MARGWQAGGDMSDWFRQEPHGVRFDWGPAGAEHLAPASAGLVIVDVLSFSTAVTVAVEAGIRVFPYPRHDDAAAAFARRRRAVLAAEGRVRLPDTPWSLTPDIAAAVAGSVSGRELSQRGFPGDVVLASEVDTCEVAAILADGAFEAAG